MTAPALPGAAPDPVPGHAPGRNDPARLPPEVERAIGKCCDAHGAYATARERGTIPQIDKAFKAAESAEAALRTAIARALGGDGEPVAWWCRNQHRVDDQGIVTFSVSHADSLRRDGFTVVPLYTRPASTGDTGEGAHPNGPVEGCPCHLCRYAFGEDSPADDARGAAEREALNRFIEASIAVCAWAERPLGSRGPVGVDLDHFQRLLDTQRGLYAAWSSFGKTRALLAAEAASRAATGDHPSEARRGHESEGRGGPDAR